MNWCNNCTRWIQLSFVTISCHENDLFRRSKSSDCGSSSSALLQDRLEWTCRCFCVTTITAIFLGTQSGASDEIAGWVPLQTRNPHVFWHVGTSCLNLAIFFKKALKSDAFGPFVPNKSIVWVAMTFLFSQRWELSPPTKKTLLVNISPKCETKWKVSRNTLVNIPWNVTSNGNYIIFILSLSLSLLNSIT